MAELAGDLGAANNLPLSIEFEGGVDPHALQRALLNVAAAHPALRTEFVTHDGRLRRIERRVTDVELPIVDVEDDVEKVIEERSRFPLDLLREPWNATLVRSARGRHALLAIFHHAIFDGPSKDVFVDDILDEYAAVVSGTERGRVRAVPYVQHVSREQRAIEQLGAHAREYWEPRLPQVRSGLAWPRSAHAAPSEHASAEALRFTISAERRDRLAAAAGSSVFTALVAVVQLLQHAHAGRAAGTIVTGVPLGTRQRDERREIGMFVNEVPVCSEPDPQLPFSEFVAATGQRLRELMSLRDFPYTEAVSRFGRGYDPRTLAPSVAISYWRTTGGARADRRLPVYGRRVRLSFRFVEGPEGIDAGIEYDSSLLHRQAAHRVVIGLSTLIDRVSSQPDLPLRELSPIPPDERELLTETWNATGVDYPSTTVVELIRDRARRHPERLAVEAPDGTLTYGGLEHRAESLRRRLAQLGVDRTTVVGIYMEPSLDLLIGVLGTLKAGAAYAPLDPRYPVERLEFMVRDSRASLVLADDGLAPQLSGLERPVITIGDATDPPGPPSLPARPKDRAYIIYTSGSTGRPKGVELMHAGLSNLVRTMCETPGLGEEDAYLAMTTLSFDQGSVDLLAPLTVGAKVIIAPSLTSTDGEAMCSALSNTGATVTFATPSSWKLAVGAGWQGRQTVLVGGERLPPSLATELVRRSPAVWNTYGPTETTVFSTCRRIVDGSDVTIGRPVANTRLYVVDQEGRLAPLGTPGELWIAGAGVARGYLNRRELTAERFIVDPFRAGADRLYKTGDVVRYRDDGDLEFLGRRDEQVKIRGNRIEPGEIEAVLASRPGVREAVVVAREAAPGDVRLVAYVIGSGADATPRALRVALAERLPGPMIPSAFVRVDALPLLPNGKVDRLRLPEPPAEIDGDDHVPPADPTEEALVAIWASVLGVERVSTCANFFELGGHSLLAADVVARARQVLATDIPIGLVFAAPTVQQMARELRSRSASGEPRDSPRVPTRRPLFRARLIRPLWAPAGWCSDCSRRRSSS
jgi:amino acid adenylation domain-containing protein